MTLTGKIDLEKPSFDLKDHQEVSKVIVFIRNKMNSQKENIGEKKGKRGRKLLSPESKRKSRQEINRRYYESHHLNKEDLEIIRSLRSIKLYETK